MATAVLAREVLLQGVAVVGELQLPRITSQAGLPENV